jgi:hypothetical protein
MENGIFWCGDLGFQTMDRASLRTLIDEVTHEIKLGHKLSSLLDYESYEIARICGNFDSLQMIFIKSVDRDNKCRCREEKSDLLG